MVLRGRARGLLFGGFSVGLASLLMGLPGRRLWECLGAGADLGLARGSCIRGRPVLTLPSFSSCLPGMAFRRRPSMVASGRTPRQLSFASSVTRDSRAMALPGGSPFRCSGPRRGARPLHWRGQSRLRSAMASGRAGTRSIRASTSRRRPGPACMPPARVASRGRAGGLVGSATWSRWPTAMACGRFTDTCPRLPFAAASAWRWARSSAASARQASRPGPTSTSKSVCAAPRSIRRPGSSDLSRKSRFSFPSGWARSDDGRGMSRCQSIGDSRGWRQAGHCAGCTRRVSPRQQAGKVRAD